MVPHFYLIRDYFEEATKHVWYHEDSIDYVDLWHPGMDRVNAVIRSVERY